MPKLLWVALPLVAWAIALAVLALRGRLSRATLNAWSSILLLAYLATTASLGIFWVANQQLPVFDWHYLFGYGTVLLATVHLAINLPLVWRYFARGGRDARPAAAASSPSPARRHALTAVFVAAASAVAFTIGLRHRVGEIRFAAPASGPPASDEALAIVERFHTLSSHSRSGVLLRAPGAEWQQEPPAFKRYPGADRIALTEAGTVRPDAPVLARIGAALWHTSGITERRGALALRASPSSGALFSTELYLQARAVPGLADGLWHYDAEGHVLERLAAQAALPDASAPAVIATAVFARTGRKYRDRTYRYVLADLGHALANLRVAAQALGFASRFLPGFDEERIALALGLDQAQEGVLAVTLLATQGAANEALPAYRRAPTASLADTSARSVTSSIHAATSMHTVRQRPRVAASAVATPMRIALPRGAAAPANPLHTIATRRSIRRFASDRPLPFAALAAVLARMDHESQPRLSDAVRIYVVANAVEQLAPGAYAYLPDAHALAPRRTEPLRRAAHAAALDQDVIGDAAAVFVVTIDRASFAADAQGAARGYRHAFLQAGLVGESIYLEAAARGLGACAVGAFYDDEAAALIAVDPAREWVVHFAALGVPAA